MTGEQKLWIAVLLQGLAEREERFVCVKSRYPARNERQRACLSRKARSFVLSDDFSHICGQVGLSPELLRRIAPEDANAALQRLMYAADNPEPPPIVPSPEPTATVEAINYLGD
jgi:hypothetical protein